MSEQGLAARALAGARALVPSRRRAADADADRPARTVADLVRQREEAARLAAGDPATGGPDVAARPVADEAAAADAADGPATAEEPQALPADNAAPETVAVARPARLAFASNLVRRTAPRVLTERDGAVAPIRRVVDPDRPVQAQTATPVRTVPALAPRAIGFAPTADTGAGSDADTGPIPVTPAPDAAEPTADAGPDDEPGADEPAGDHEAAAPGAAVPDGGEPCAHADLAVAASPADAPDPALDIAPGDIAPGDIEPIDAAAAPAAEPAVERGTTPPAGLGPVAGEPGGFGLGARAEAPDARPTGAADTDPAPTRPSRAAVPALLSDAELMEAIGVDEEPAEPEPPVVVMSTSPQPPPGARVRTDALAPPWVRAALMGAEPRLSATPEQASATRALRRTFGVPQDPGPVALSGVEPPGAVAVLSRSAVRPVVAVPPSIVGAPVPIRYRVCRRDGSVVAGAEVTVVDCRGTTVGDSRVGLDGRGRFVAQQPGPYLLIGAAPGFQPGAMAVNAVGGTVDVDVLLVRSASVSGVVRLDGDPVPSAQLTLVQDGEVVDMVVADPTGRFRLTDLTGGEYALAVAAERCPPTVLVLTVPEEADLVYDVDLASPRPSP